MFMTAQQLQNVEMRRSLTFSFRGEPASFTRLQQLRRGAKAPPAEQANAADESSPLVRLQKDDQPLLQAQLRYWGVDESTKGEIPRAQCVEWEWGVLCAPTTDPTTTPVGGN